MADITPLPAALQGPPPVNPGPTKEQVETAINESTSLVEALESVGALYGIPSENIIVDDRVNSIQVRGDQILAPDRPNPSANTQAIVCAIGAVLDHISQRIDQKLDGYQANQISTNALKAKQRTPNPAKGEVIERVFDANGDEIIIYSSGLVDMEATPAANAKVAELRAAGKIPEYKPSAPTTGSSYFTDEENDIMSNAKPPVENMQVSLNKAEHDIASAIHESAMHVDLYDELHGSTTMGCDLLRGIGFDFVEPIQSVVQEAAKQPKIADPKGLKYMKFDNKNIIKAVNSINAAYKEIGMKTPSLRELCRNDNFKDAIRFLEKQFDCHLAIDFFDVKDEDGKKVTTGYTSIYDRSINQHITISKAKGFQMHGEAVKIILAGEIFQMSPAGRESDTFGQAVVSVILHEIFHNIAGCIRKDNDAFISTVTSSMMLATATDNLRNRRVILSNAVNAAAAITGQKVGRIEKRKLVKQLMSVAASKYDAEAVNEIKRSIQSADASELANLDRYIAKLEGLHSELHAKYEKGKKKPSAVRVTIGTIMVVIGIIMMVSIILLPVGLLLMFGGDKLANITESEYAKNVEKWLSITNKEEYYCDMFAGMYGLPVAFQIGSMSSKLTANMVDHDRLQKLSALERDLGKLVFDPHPSGQERSLAGMKIAKNLLNSGEKLDPAVKKYCEWIVDNYSSLEETDLNEIYQSNIFDPKEAEDLDQHLQNLVKNNSITVTESWKRS